MFDFSKKPKCYIKNNVGIPFVKFDSSYSHKYLNVCKWGHTNFVWQICTKIFRLVFTVNLCDFYGNLCSLMKTTQIIVPLHIEQNVLYIKTVKNRHFLLINGKLERISLVFGLKRFSISYLLYRFGCSRTYI
jgi:hypothetical protein